MVAIPTPYTWTDGQLPNALLLNPVFRDLVNLVINPPRALATQHTVQSLTTGTWNGLTLDVESIDSDNMHSTTTNTSRFTCVTPGTYLVSGSVNFAASSAGARRGARIYKNGAAYGIQVLVPQASALSGVPTVHAPQTLVPMVAGDYVELFAYQDSGAAINTVADQSFMQAIWVAA